MPKRASGKISHIAISNKMKYETAYESYQVEIYTDDYEEPRDGLINVQAIITTPEGRWVQPIVVSTMLMENLDAFKQVVAEDVYYSYINGNK
jgi:hypothetical protein